MNTRIMAVALVVVGLLAVRTTQAQAEDVEILRIVPILVSPDQLNPLNGSFVGSTHTIIVIGMPNNAAPPTPSNCGGLAQDKTEAIEVIVLTHPPFSPQVQPAVRLTMFHAPGVNLEPGTRLGDYAGDSLLCCLDQADSFISCASMDALRIIWVTFASVIEPASAGVALLSSPVELDSDSIGVVTGQPNDDGAYTVIFKNQGSPTQHVDVATDDVLLPADVLRDLIDLGQDPDTGEHLYLADIEW